MSLIESLGHSITTMILYQVIIPSILFYSFSYLSSTPPTSNILELQWYKLNNKNQRVPVKLDFRIEHVITGAIHMSFKQHQQLNHQYPKHPFVLSNSGLITNETKQKLNQWKCKLLESESNTNVNNNNNSGNEIIYLQHHLIIWASKPDDAGRYFASNQYPSNTDGISSTEEKEFILQVISKLIIFICTI